MGAIDDIKERLDIVEIISGYTQLQKAGRNYKALCPFHSEKTPSFVVFPDTQTWHCFGACNTGGDVFTFVMRRENMDFGEALRLLAQRAGVSLEPLREGEEAETRLKERLYKLNALAAEYFHYLLLNSPEGARARDYLTRRGLSAETGKTFQLGYAREDWQALGQHLTAKGYSWSDLQEAGLVIEGKEHGYYDRFRGRLIFPIRDARANVVGFGARALDDSLPKYLNSPQTAIFDKSGVLYGIDQAKGAIREAGLVVIVEGYMDVLMAHQCNRKNVVASMGTALTEKHVRIIKKMTKKLVLALDADSAGDQATVRGLEVAQEAFDRRAMPVPTWRGLIRYEDQLDAEIRVAVLPPGLDPDEVLKENVDTWDVLVNRALPVVEYYLQAVIGKFDLRSPKDKVAAAREVLPLIREIGSSVERSHYLQQLARLLRVDERTLQQELEGRKAPPARTGREVSPALGRGSTSPAQNAGRGTGRRESAPAAERFGRLSAQPGLTFGLEQYVLLLLLKRPEFLASMNALLLGLGMEPLAGEDLTEIDKRAIFEWIAAHIEQRRPLDLDALRQEVDPSLRPALEAVLSLIEGVAFLSDEQAELDAAKCALRLRELRLHRRNEELRYLQEDARAQNDGEAARNWGRMVDELTTQLVRIQREEAAQSSLKSPRQEQTQG
jgi:DNA primase